MIRENKELEEKHSKDVDKGTEETPDKDSDKGTEETYNVEEDLSNLSVEELEKISQRLDDEIAQKQTEIDDKKKQILIQSITSKRGRLKELAREEQQLTEQIEQQPTKGPQK